MQRDCPKSSPECPHFGTAECKKTVHHKYYPKSIYKSVIERAFRNLPDNKVDLPWCDHQELHATQPVPIKPDLRYMADEITVSAVNISASLRKAIKGL